MGGLLQKSFRADSQQGYRLLWVNTFGFLLNLGTIILSVVAVTDFLLAFDFSLLPGAMICSGLAGVFVSNTWLSVRNWVSYMYIAVPGSLLLLISVVGVFIYHLVSSSPAVHYLTFVLSGPLIALSHLLFRGLSERFFDVAEIKRFHIMTDTGPVIGAVSALFVIASGIVPVEWKQPEPLYLFSAFFFGGAFFTLVTVCSRYNILSEVEVNVQYIKAYNSYKNLVKQPYALCLIAFSLLSAVVFYLTDYTFLRLVDLKYDSYDRLLSFLSTVTAIIVVAGYLIEIFLLKPVTEKHGFLVTLLLAPVLTGLFTVIYGTMGIVYGYVPDENTYFFIFILLSMSKGVSQSLYRAFEYPVFRLFFMPLNPLLRGDIQAKVEEVSRQAAVAVAGAFVLTALYYMEFSRIPYLITALVIIWCIVAFRMNKGYRDKLTQNLGRQTTGELERIQGSAEGVSGSLIKAMDAGTADQVKVYMGLLKRLDPVSYSSSLLDLLRHDNDEIQKVALLETSGLSLLTAIPVLENIKASKFFPVLKNRDLIEKVYVQLKGADFRLKNKKYVEHLTISGIRKERIFGALLSAYIAPDLKAGMLNKLFNDRDRIVRYMAVVSSSGAVDTSLQKNLVEKFREPACGNAAVSSVTANGEACIKTLVNLFYMTGQEEKVQLRIVQALGSTGTYKAVEHLVKMLNYRNQNVSKTAFEAISKSGFNIKGEKVLAFRAELQEYVGVLTWNMSAFKDLQQAEVSDIMLEALKSEIDDNYRVIFRILSLLSDPEMIGLIEKNIFSDNAEKSEYAAELLEVVLSDEMKPFLLPVLNTRSFEERVSKMQGQFPTESMAATEVLSDLVHRDYKYVNRWTKACALKELAEQESWNDTQIYLANIINPDPLLKETAAVALYVKAPQVFYQAWKRFGAQLETDFSKGLENKVMISQEMKTKAFSAPGLQYSIIRFLNEVDCFRKVPGIVLIELAKLCQFRKFAKGELVMRKDTLEEADYLVIMSGAVGLYIDGDLLKTFTDNVFVHTYDLLPGHSGTMELKAEKDTRLYVVDRDRFNELMSFHEEVPYSIINHTKSEKLAPVLEEPVPAMS